MVTSPLNATTAASLFAFPTNILPLASTEPLTSAAYDDVPINDVALFFPI